jgi:glycosyltransferase involved in cell wall biosynthesis
MSKILLLSYYFPPIGGAGAQRPVKFARYLHASGHEVVVLTGSGRTGAFWTPADPTLELDVPRSVEVVRVPGPEPQKDGGGSRLGRMIRVDGAWVRWWQEGIEAQAPGLEGVDVVYTIMSPFTSAAASDRLARKLGVDWIADLGDPWALDEMAVYPTALHRRLEQRRMRRLLGTASAIVMSTPEAARQVEKAFPELRARPIVAIPNGYDGADFEAADGVERDPTKFRIVHTGYLHTSAGLQQRQRSALRRLIGGGAPGVDILTRSHVFLLEAVDRLLARDPSLRGRLEVHLAGVLSGPDREVAARSPVTVLHGYVSHLESIRLMRSADLLFLPMQNLAEGRRSSTVPGKTYEYLASGRPILGAIPPGDARDVLEESGRARICRPDDVEGIARAIVDAMESSDEPTAEDRLALRFAYSTLTQKAEGVVADVLHRTRHAPGVPGMVPAP